MKTSFNRKRLSMNTRIELFDLVPKQGRIVEVGVLRGEFAAQIRERRGDLQYTGIDSWDKHYAQYHNAAIRHVGGWGTLIKATSVYAASKLEYEVFDLVYIDAFHEREAVLADLNAWWPKVKKGGILSGHDYEMKGVSNEWEAIEVKDAVDDWAKQNGLTVNVIWENAPTWYIWKP